MKIRPVEAELFHVDGLIGSRTDMMKLIAAFRKEREAREPRITQEIINKIDERSGAMSTTKKEGRATGD